MLTINATSPRAPRGDAATGSPVSRTANDPAGFASLLRQNRVAPLPAPAPAPAPTAAPAPAPALSVDPKPTTHSTDPVREAPAESKTPQESDPAHRARAFMRGKLRAADGQTPTTATAKPEADAAKEAEPAVAGQAATEICNAPETKATTTESALDPSVMHWLAAQQRSASASGDEGATRAGARSARSTGTGTSTDIAADAGTSLAEPRGAARGQRPADLKADADLKDKAAHGKALLADAGDARQFAGVLAEQRIAEKPAPSAIDRVGSIKDTAAAGSVALAPAPNAGTDAAAPAAVAIAAPVGAPDFAQELGLRLSVLAKDGVQSAELHLNPADMGPVSVQIVMDGTQARVDFGADIAATRQAIEAGLPELASALRDAGFTLAGGGVSQHAGGRQGGGDSGAPQGERRHGLVVEDEVTRVATAARRIVARGGVDLFA